MTEDTIAEKNVHGLKKHHINFYTSQEDGLLNLASKKRKVKIGMNTVTIH